MTDTRGINAFKVVWIATRKHQDLAESAFGNSLLSSHLLHKMLHVKSTLPELQAASLVAIELPANVESGYEQTVLSFTARALKQCPRMLMVVQPSLRRRSNRSTWVTRWNQHRGFKPFLFIQSCSCLAGSGAAGCHVPTYVGTTEDVKFQWCNSVPCTDISVQSAKEGLCSLLQHFCKQIGHCDPLPISGAALIPRGRDAGDGYSYPQFEGATVSSRLTPRGRSRAAS